MGVLNGYFQLGVILGMLVLGFIGGWYVTKNAYEAGEGRSFAQAVKDYQKGQVKITAVDQKESTYQDGLASRTTSLKENLNAEDAKKHTVCVHTPSLRQLLHNASLPPKNLPN